MKKTLNIKKLQKLSELIISSDNESCDKILSTNFRCDQVFGRKKMLKYQLFVGKVILFRKTVDPIDILALRVAPTRAAPGLFFFSLTSTTGVEFSKSGQDPQPLFRWKMFLRDLRLQVFLQTF